MHRLILAALAVLAATAALATTTWTEVTADSAGNRLPSHVRCTTGAYTLTTEAAPSSTTAGFDLTGIGGLSFEAESTGTLAAGGKYTAYLLNKVSGNWAPVLDGSLDLQVATAGPRAAWSGATVTADWSRIAFEPYLITSPSTLTICGTAKR